jgi:hypothetical protein
VRNFTFAIAGGVVMGRDRAEMLALRMQHKDQGAGELGVSRICVSVMKHLYQMRGLTSDFLELMIVGGREVCCPEGVLSLNYQRWQ